MPFDVLFEPLTIKYVTIPNRFASTSHQPGYPVAGAITERYIRYEAEKATRQCSMRCGSARIHDLFVESPLLL